MIGYMRETLSKIVDEAHEQAYKVICYFIFSFSGGWLEEIWCISSSLRLRLTSGVIGGTYAETGPLDRQYGLSLCVCAQVIDMPK